MAEPRDAFVAAREFTASRKPRNPRDNPYPPGSEQWDWFNAQLAKTPTPAVSPPISTGYDAGAFAGLPGAEKLAPPPAPASPVYHGGLLPFSRDSAGKVYFDPINAGPVGAVRTGMQYTQDLLTGQKAFPRTFNPAVLPPSQTSDAMGNILNIAGFGVGMNPALKVAPRTITGAKVPSDYSMVEPLSGPATKERGADQIQAFKTLPINYDPHYVGTNLATRMEQAAHDAGGIRSKNSNNSPQLHGFIDDIKDFLPQSNDPSATIQVTPASLAKIRENITGLYGKDTEHYAAVKAAHKVLDEFLSNTPPEAFASGNNPKLEAIASPLYGEGRGNYAAGANDETFGQIQREADVRNTFSNRDKSATVKNRVAAAILKADEDRSLSPDQQAALMQVPEKSWPRSIASGVGNVLSSGPLGSIGYGMGVGAGHFMGLGEAAPYVGMAVPALGKAMTTWAGNTAPAALDVARRYMLQQSPAFQDKVALGRGRGDIDVTPNVPGNTALSTAQSYFLTHPSGTPLSADDTPTPPISY
jgi:hypothetical protein